MIVFTIDITTAINNAAQKLEKPKFPSPTNADVIFNIIALITKLNNPNVMIVRGKEKKLRIGLINVFKIDNTKDATMAIQILFTKIIVGNITDSEMKINVLATKR